MEDLSQKREKEKKVSSLMIKLYYKKKREKKAEGEELERYVFSRIDHCPYMANKTFCSNCKTHCYRPDMREKIKAVMRYSGPRMLFYHPVLAIKHMVLTLKEKKKKVAY